MTREQILALLKLLGITLGEEGGLSEDDAVKLVEDSVKAANLGLIQKRDELLANEVKLKEKITALEAGATDSAKKVAELEDQVKKANPEAHKTYYEGLAKELETKHAAEKSVIEAERDKFRDSHYARVRDDAINTALKDVQFVDGLRDGFISLAMMRNQFKASDIDGKTVFTNQDNDTIESVLHKLTLTAEGKAYIKNQNQGGGSTGAQPGAGTGSAGQTIKREQFDGMTPAARMDFITKGGKVTE